MPSHDTTETVLTYVDDDGAVYEVDHLGICMDSQWGEFAVYWQGALMATFSVGGAGLLPQYRPALPAAAELTTLAKAAVADD